MRPPSDKRLNDVERQLKRLPKGTQRKLGGWVYMRIDGEGRRRFTYRGTNGLAGGTCDSWPEAFDARQALEAKVAVVDGNPDDLSALALRKWTLRDYAVRIYWPSALEDLDATTRRDYRRILFNDLLPVAGHYTIEELVERPLIIDRIKQDIKKLKTFPDDHIHRPGEVPLAACDAVLKLGSAVLEHAQLRGITSRNPFRGIARFRRVRRRGRGKGGSYVRIKPSQVMHPKMVARVGLGMRGAGAQLLERRIVPVLIAIGMRPQDICAMRWSWCRDIDGFRRYISTTDAVKDLGGHLVLGEPKTGTRDLYLFDWVAMLLGRLYEAQGRPSLSGLVIPNSNGDLLDWGNWRDGIWYPALHRAGIAEAAEPNASGALDPYLIRHIGATTMLHALRHDGHLGSYSSEEVARQFGHTAETLHRVYADIPNNLHGVAGLTMDQILATAWAGIWGPMPGEEGYEEVLVTTAEASELTGIAINALGGRIARGTLPAQRIGSRYAIAEWDLVWNGLLVRPSDAGDLVGHRKAHEIAD